jgi:hypothetical protein
VRASIGGGRGKLVFSHAASSYPAGSHIKMRPLDMAKFFHCTVAHGPKQEALRGVTPHFVTDMCMYSHATVGVSPHDCGMPMV